MSYQMIHMEVAYRLLGIFGWIENPSDYILGSIAPDSIHFNPQYSLDLKANSHLWSFGPRWGITTESDKWRDYILSYWDLHKIEKNKDYIAGYCVHVLTDWLNDKVIFAPFRKRIKSVEEYDDIYAVYAKEAHGSDQWLYQYSPNTQSIISLLERGKPHHVAGRVYKEDVVFQKEHILRKQYREKENIDIGKYHYCTEAVTKEFLNECVRVISGLMKE